MLSLSIEKLIRRRLLMVGGKGGVGKTTVSAALALLAARGGRNTLLVSTDPAHSLGDCFQIAIGDHITPVEENLSVLEIDPETELDVYLESIRRQMLSFAALSQRTALERQLELTRHSPGAEEAALLERITKIIDREDCYDLIVFDTAPTGHTLRLLHLPQTMAAWSRGLLFQRERGGRLRSLLAHLKKESQVNPLKESAPGAADVDERQQKLLAPLRDRERRFRKVAKLLQDKAHCSFLFVMTAEPLPLAETTRAISRLRSQGVPVGGLVVNRLLPEMAAEIAFLRGLYRQQQDCLVQITERFADIPQRHLPLFGAGLEGREGLVLVAEKLADNAAGETFASGLMPE